MKRTLKRLIFPGINLHTRDRFSTIPTFFDGDIGPGQSVLDAGCGNGMMAWQAWKRGAKVLGVSIKQKEVEGCQAMFNEDRKIPQEELRFQNLNLYEMQADEHQFDAIICTEVLEHIRDDVGVCRKFFDLLRPGGTVHVTSPNAEHPYNASFPLDPHENGGHVRAGYTEQTYRELLEPIGFDLERFAGLGGPVRQAFSRRIKETQERFGAWSGVPLFVVSLPFLFLDAKEPAVPFSVYVKARKPK